MVNRITSVNNGLIKELYKLKNKKHSIESGMFLIEGSNIIEEALKEGFLLKLLYVDNNYGFSNSIQVTSGIIKKLSSLSTPQGVIGICKFVENNIIKNERILLLDGINIPNNIGTMIRSALAFNFDGVIVSEDSAYIYNPKCVFSSQGAIFKIPVIQTNIKNYLQNTECKIYPTTLSNDSIDLDAVSSVEKMIFIMGSESNGVSKDILEMNKNHIKIGIKNIDSLNVSTAAGIILNKFKK